MKILTVPSSNYGRSIGDVFLALSSSVHLNCKVEPIGFLTHTNHAEITSFFRKHIDIILLSDSAATHADLLDTVNIHWNGAAMPQLLHDISNPWRYFIINQVCPSALTWYVPYATARTVSGCVVIFPERSDNQRLNDEFFSDFILHAKRKGLTVYTNCYINSNYSISPALPGTLPLSQISLSEIVAIASDPSNILVGTRSGLFDVLYFVLPMAHARLLIIYPPAPVWLWSTARFHNDSARIKYPSFYIHRDGVIEIEQQDFNSSTFSKALIEL